MADCTKHPYEDQAAARAALAVIRRKPKHRTGKRPCRVYPCNVCEYWHLTSKRNRGKTPPWDLDPSWVRPPAATPRRP